MIWVGDQVDSPALEGIGPIGVEFIGTRIDQLLDDLKLFCLFLGLHFFFLFFGLGPGRRRNQNEKQEKISYYLHDEKLIISLKLAIILTRQEETPRFLGG